MEDEYADGEAGRRGAVGREKRGTGNGGAHLADRIETEVFRA